MRHFNYSDATGVLFAIVVFFLGLVGWIINIVALATAVEPMGLTILRALGVLMAPIGAVLGWFV